MLRIVRFREVRPPVSVVRGDQVADEIFHVFAGEIQEIHISFEIDEGTEFVAVLLGQSGSCLGKWTNLTAQFLHFGRPELESVQVCADAFGKVFGSGEFT